MRILHGTVLAGGLLLVVSLVAAQPPAGDSSKAANSSEAERFVARMMAFDTNQDGKLTKDEVTDTRLHRLFDRADANKDGVVTKEELLALFTKENPHAGGDDFGPPGGFGPPGDFDPPGPGGPDGPGGPGGRGPGGRGRGGFGGPPQPGQVLPASLQGRLKLTAEQRKQVADLQKDVDARLAKILTADQKKTLADMQQRGPGGFGPPGFGRPSEGGRPSNQGDRPRDERRPPR